MEEILETYSYNIDDNYKVLLDIKGNPYNIETQHLFKMAARKNTKREFLFISRVIGKHLPMYPLVLKLIGGILARSWVEKQEGVKAIDMEVLLKAFRYIQCEGIHPKEEELVAAKEALKNIIRLKHKTLFIGFAETATGLAQAVFSMFSNAGYIHTTRENISSVKPSVLFEEEHSHAVEHQLFPLNPEFLKEYEDIVLIDDELTTGKTAINLISKLKGTRFKDSSFKDSRFGIISILDWRSKEQESLCSKEISVCSLVKGDIDYDRSGELDVSDVMHEDFLPQAQSTYKQLVYNKGNFFEGYLMETGRFGIISENQLKFNKEIEEIATELRKIKCKGQSLCIGTEEFIYIPCAISCEMGEDVHFQSTTRSPIFVRNLPNYGINNKLTFRTTADKHVPKFIYNLHKGFYNQVFMFSEKPLEEAEMQEFSTIFKQFDIKEVIFICFKGEENE